MQPCSAFQAAPPFVNPHTLPRQDGEIHVSINSGVLIIPKVFLNQSDESEEAAKELTINVAKTDAKTDAKDEPKKSAAVKLVGTKQKVKKQAATDKKEVEQKTAAGHAAPAKENAPVKRCSAVSFPSARVVLVSATLFFAVTMALRKTQACRPMRRRSSPRQVRLQLGRSTVRDAR